MARTIPHRELRNNSSAILLEVKAGETFTITNHGEPVATLSPITDRPAPSVQSRPATIKGRFSEIVSVPSDVSSEEILEGLRAER
jgi:prevent-host-death family protein